MERQAPPWSVEQSRWGILKPRAGLLTTDELRLHSQSLPVARDSFLPLKLQVLFAWGFYLWCKSLTHPTSTLCSEVQIREQLGREENPETRLKKKKSLIYSLPFRTHWKRPWCWERLKARGEGGDRGWDGWNGITDSMDMSSSKLREIVKDREAQPAAIHGVTKTWTQFSDQTTAATIHMNENV